MPIYEYKQVETGRIEEHYFPTAKTAPAAFADAAGKTTHVRITRGMIANTPGRWGDSGEKRRFDRGLGCWVDGDKHAREIAASRGLTPVTELGTEAETDQAFDSALDKLIADNAAREAESAKIVAALAKHGGSFDATPDNRANQAIQDANARAMEEVWPAQRFLGGDLDDGTIPEIVSP